MEEYRTIGRIQGTHGLWGICTCLIALFLILSAIPAYCDSITVQWDSQEFGVPDPQAPDCGFRLYMGLTPGGPYVQEGEDIPPDQTEYSFIDKDWDTTKYLVLTAFNPSGESLYSDEVNYTVGPLPIPGSPQNVTVITVRSSK